MCTTTWRNIIPQLQLTWELRTKQYFTENQIYKGTLKSSPFRKFSCKKYVFVTFFIKSKKIFRKTFFQNKIFWAIYFLWSTQILIFIEIGAAEKYFLARFGVAKMVQKCLQARQALMGLIIFNTWGFLRVFQGVVVISNRFTIIGVDK